MANLGTVIVKNTKYTDIETLLGQPFEVGSTYHLQVLNSAMLCPKATQPKEEEGYYINTSALIYDFKKETEALKLFVKVNEGQASINICE